MRFTERLCLATLLSTCLAGVTPSIEVSLAHGTAREERTRDQLQRLLKAYDLSDWVWTRKVLIEEGAIPHSHPVLTLNTRHMDDDSLSFRLSCMKNIIGMKRATHVTHLLQSQN